MKLKKRIQILTVAIICILNLCICNNAFAVNKTSGSTISSGNRTSGGSTGSGTVSSGGNRTSTSGTGGNRTSTGITMNGKNKQTTTPSGSVDPDSYKPKELTTSDAGDFIDIVNSVIAAIQIFGAVVAAVAIIALGIKYMLGSVQDKATYKETMIPYLIGAVMVFAIPTIVRVIFEVVTQISF